MNVCCVLLKRLPLNTNFFPSFDIPPTSFFLMSCIRKLFIRVVFIRTTRNVFRWQHFIRSKVYTEATTWGCKLGAKVMFLLWLSLWSGHSVSCSLLAVVERVRAENWDLSQIAFLSIVFCREWKQYALWGSRSSCLVLLCTGQLSMLIRKTGFVKILKVLYCFPRYIPLVLAGGKPENLPVLR